MQCDRKATSGLCAHFITFTYPTVLTLRIRLRFLWIFLFWQKVKTKHCGFYHVRSTNIGSLWKTCSSCKADIKQWRGKYVQCFYKLPVSCVCTEISDPNRNSEGIIVCELHRRNRSLWLVPYLWDRGRFSNVNVKKCSQKISISEFGIERNKTAFQ